VTLLVIYRFLDIINAWKMDPFKIATLVSCYSMYCVLTCHSIQHVVCYVFGLDFASLMCFKHDS